MHRYLFSMMMTFGLLLAWLCSPASAQSRRTAPAGAWMFDVAPLYAWLPALEGDLTVRGRTAAVDVSAGEFVETLFDSFKFAASGRVEARQRDLILTLDVLYLSMEEDGETPLGGQVDVEFSQLLLEFGGGFRLGTWRLGRGVHPVISLEALGGGRYVNLDTELGIAGAGPLGRRLDVDKTVDWLEPFIGGRVRFTLSEKLALVIRGDVGGFGLGSNLTWALVSTLQYHVSRRIVLAGGYRVLDIDYDEGSGTNRFVYDVISHGPTFGFALRF